MKKRIISSAGEANEKQGGARHERLQKNLRENLKKRKAQARHRRAEQSKQEQKTDG